MKRYSFLYRLPVYLLALYALSGCETVIDARLDTGPIQLSVDATLTDQPGPQTIRLTQTAAYFNSSTPPAALSATVTVSDDAGKTYAFTDNDNDGYYVWQPKVATDTLGHIGRTYQLNIAYQNEVYRSTSKLNRVPAVDSITFVKKKLNPLSKTEGYRAEFYSRDLPGATDYYRIRYFRNGTLQNKARDIITTQDGAFRGNANTDGLMFILPIRRSVNPDSLYAFDDVVKVEVQSLTLEAYDFWEELQAQISNGGLFATPPTNVPTNIVNTNASGRKAVGFFITSAVRSRTARVATENLRPDTD
ncbi:DUF4249 domain-containing protein [Spirosoma endbachense]|uniref:DUF4249 family protein n=1 Tax=Spirosoma endbachense TaxID=2666025 RepID=A0A6P1W4V8_9BACT|nr:DUF4249 domain-containing protein [Spirosoma endbachense]QHV99047.1 DUF4249 family protein [Spirosoma endbachense]